VPLLVKKNRILFAFLITTIATFPFLYILDVLTTGNWFILFGAPAAAASLTVTWVVYLIFKYVKTNGWNKAAAALFMYGVVLSSAIQIFVARLFGDGMWSQFTLSTFVNLASCLFITILLFIIGAGRRNITPEPADISKSTN
jgi:glucose-6-phosphate-specific signal transduction histidine kinase